MAEMSPLKRKRLAAGLSQAEIASRVGVSVVGYSQWENGKRTPSAEYFPKLATVLGITAAEVVSLIEETLAAVASR